jgi:hypothetical protein
MKKSVIIIILALPFCFILSCQSQHTKAEPEASESSVPVTYPGVPQVIVVSGTDYEMGVQYGRQSAPSIHHNLALFKTTLHQVFGKETVDKDMKVWAYYIEKHDPALKEWLEGISAGCRETKRKISYIDLVLITVFWSESWARPNAPYPDEALKKAKLPESKTGAHSSIREVDNKVHACSSFAATGTATKDGKPLVAISTMLTMSGIRNLILIAFPAEGSPFISIPIAGTVTFNAALNRAGFAWATTAIYGPEPIWGLASEGYFHYLAQFCTSPDEARKYLATTPRAGVTGDFIMSDAAGDISVLESNPQDIAIRKPGDLGENSFLVNTNHFVGPDMKSDNPPQIDESDSFYRYATMWEYASAGAESSEIDFSFVKEMFMSDDWFDPKSKEWHYNDPGSPNGLNNFSGSKSVAQTILFPASLVAFFQLGTPSGIGIPAYATGEYVGIKLAEDPQTVMSEAKWIALSNYHAARNLFQKELNRSAPYLTYSIAQSIEQKLDEAFSAYEQGGDREMFAYLEENLSEKLRLTSEAMTHYAKAQLYAKMVRSDLEKLRGQAQ